MDSYAAGRNGANSRTQTRIVACGSSLLLALCFAAGAQVQAQTRAVAELSLRAPAGAGCASQSEIAAQVGRLSERPLAQTTRASRYRIEAELREESGAWRANIRVVDGWSGRASAARELAGKPGDCRSLDVASAVVIATLLDGLPEPERAAPVADGGEAHDFALGAGFAAGIGLGPSPLFGGQLELQFPWPLRLEASVYAPRDELDARGRGARLWAWQAGIAVCPLNWGRDVTFELCANGQLGAMHARGVGLEPSLQAARLLALLGVEPKLGVALGKGPVRIRVQFSTLVGWVALRPRFTMDLGHAELRSLRGNTFALLLRIGIIVSLP